MLETYITITNKKVCRTNSAVRVLLFLFLITALLTGCTSIGTKGQTPASIPDSTKYTVYYQQTGNLTNSAFQNTVWVYSEHCNDPNIETDLYMWVQLEDTYIRYELGKNLIGAVQDCGQLTLIDLNNDGIDEIIVFFETGGNGETLAKILRIRDQSVECLSDLNELTKTIDITREQNRILLVQSQLASSISKTIDISDFLIAEAFDENGVLNPSISVFTGPLSLNAVMIYNQGTLPVLICNKGLFADGYIGDLGIEIQYNSGSEAFALTDIFFPSTGDGSLSSPKQANNP